jgi:uncharacterized membrane protein
LALLLWLVNPWAFTVATLWVVFVLYRREFHSTALQTLNESLEYKTLIQPGSPKEPEHN